MHDHGACEAALADALSALGKQDDLAAWLAVVRPAWALAMGQGEALRPEVGDSRFFGDPDLPPSEPWPTVADCTLWEPLPEVDPRLPCRFVAQIRTDVLQLAGQPCLPRGLLAVFAFQELWNTGTAGGCLRFFPEGMELQRRSHPEPTPPGTIGVREPMANARLEPRRALLTPQLTLRESYGPFADELPEELPELEEKLREAEGGGRSGLYGHLRATTGEDPSPSAEHWRLVVIPIDASAVAYLHFAMHPRELAGGRVDRAELVWVDFDG